MKIISWNVKNGLNNIEKIKRISSLAPDIAILQEVQNSQKSEKHFQFEDCLWVGEGKARGLGVGVFTFSKDYKLDLLVEDIKYEWIIPIKVSGKENFTLIAVWTKRMPSASYGKVLYNAFIEYENLIKNGPVIIMGDFNLEKRVTSSYSGLGGKGGYNKIIDLFNSFNLTSCYHHINKEEYGMESKYTYYHHQNLEKPFHIDYCLVSKEYIPFIRKFSIGEVSEYLSVSDHSPLIFESELNECSAKGKDELGNNKIEDKEISNLLI
ncbi:endonuclease/exonuclease/phosphatase family protein [Solibacillus sp. FSL R5-0691]|uniref:endonuclease/exonuclease/phosphatase family protein n=1 Tax=Solibacillus sp. FSL R5-0691 TaxID=2921653 RepID=UPI0030D25A15